MTGNVESRENGNSVNSINGDILNEPDPVDVFDEIRQRFNAGALEKAVGFERGIRNNELEQVIDDAFKVRRKRVGLYQRVFANRKIRREILQQQILAIKQEAFANQLISNNDLTVKHIDGKNVQATCDKLRSDSVQFELFTDSLKSKIYSSPNLVISNWQLIDTCSVVSDTLEKRLADRGSTNGYQTIVMSTMPFEKSSYKIDFEKLEGKFKRYFMLAPKKAKKALALVTSLVGLVFASNTAAAKIDTMEIVTKLDGKEEMKSVESGFGSQIAERVDTSSANDEIVRLSAAENITQAIQRLEVLDLQALYQHLSQDGERFSRNNIWEALIRSHAIRTELNELLPVAQNRNISGRIEKIDLKAELGNQGVKAFEVVNIELVKIEMQASFGKFIKALEVTNCVRKELRGLLPESIKIQYT